MLRISTLSKALNLFGAGKHGFQNGDMATNTPPTAFNAEWCNAMQEELASVVEAAGLALNGGSNAQVLEAIQRMIDIQAGNYVLDTGVANAYVVGIVPAVVAYTNGMTVRFRIVNGNTGASTLNAGGGAVPLVNDMNGALVAGDAPAGGIIAATYDAALNKFLITSLVPSQAMSQTAADARYAALIAGMPTGALIDHAGVTAPSGYLARPLAATNANVSAYPALAAAIGINWGNGATTAAGAFNIGTMYIIVTVGTTNYTLIGAASNAVGVVFTATGVGVGTGTAATQFGLPVAPADYADVAANANVATQTVGALIAHAHTTPVWNGAINGAGTVSFQGQNTTNGTISTSSTGGTANLAAGIRVLKCVKY